MFTINNFSFILVHRERDMPTLQKMSFNLPVLRRPEFIS